MDEEQFSKYVMNVPSSAHDSYLAGGLNDERISLSVLHIQSSEHYAEE